MSYLDAIPLYSITTGVAIDEVDIKVRVAVSGWLPKPFIGPNQVVNRVRLFAFGSTGSWEQV